MKTLTIALLLALATTGCNRATDPLALLAEADQLAADKDWPAAHEAYQRASYAFTEAIPELEFAFRGAIKSLAATNPEDALYRAESHFNEFVIENGQAAGPDLIGGFAGDFREVGSLDAAALITAFGRKHYPADPGLRNLESRLNKLTWQAMEQDPGNISSLRKNGSDVAADLGLVDESGTVLFIDGESLLLLIDPLTYKFISEQGYSD